MCGIVAARGPQAGAVTLAGLRRLEYRGYDSAGVAVPGARDRLRVERAVGPLDALAARIAGNPDVLDPPAGIAIGHTRWATHGPVRVRNAHPLAGCGGTVAVVHNGVIDNAAELREELLLTGHRFRSAVDSEVIAHLIEREIALGASPFAAMRKTVARLQGSWAVAALVGGSDAILLARRRSPLLVRGTEREFVVASDPTATADARGPLRLLADGDVAELGSRWRWAAQDGSDRPPAAVTESRSPRGPGAAPVQRAAPMERAAPITTVHGALVTAAAPGGPAAAAAVATTSTAAEVLEQQALSARLVDRVLTSRTTRHGWAELALPHPHDVLVLGCGTSFHAAQVIARVLRVVAGLPARAAIASEFDRRLAAPFDLAVAISQSGETADVLSALESIDAPVLAITNNAYSSIARRADAVVDCDAGLERGVAATKTFTAELLCGIGVGLAAAHALGHGDRARDAARLLRQVPGQFAAAQRAGSPIDDTVARRLASSPGWLYLGTGSGLPYASEGALKMKEITYRWAQCYPAAELKHGPLALVRRNTPAVVVDNGAARLGTAVAEVVARGGYVVTLGAGQHAVDTAFADGPPWGPIHVVPAIQLLALSVAGVLGRTVDRPRNLAKSVTVG